MFNKKVSIIVTVYNAEKYLDKCIKSIINQDYNNIQIILVNDGSTDNSLSICKEYEKLDKRVVVISSVNEGLVAARKKGILLSNGEYIGFLDSDDWIDSDMIHNIIDQSYGEDVIAFGMNEEYGYKNVLKNNSLRSGYYSKEILQSKIMSMMLCDGRFYSFGILPNLVCKLIKKYILF